MGADQRRPRVARTRRPFGACVQGQDICVSGYEFEVAVGQRGVGFVKLTYATSVGKMAVCNRMDVRHLPCRRICGLRISAQGLSHTGKQAARTNYRIGNGRSAEVAAGWLTPALARIRFERQRSRFASGDACPGPRYLSREESDRSLRRPDRPRGSEISGRVRHTANGNNRQYNPEYAERHLSRLALSEIAGHISRVSYEKSIGGVSAAAGLCAAFASEYRGHGAHVGGYLSARGHRTASRTNVCRCRARRRPLYGELGVPQTGDTEISL